MFRTIRKKLSKILYVQIWERKVQITDINTQETFSEIPIVFIEKQTDGKNVMAGVGEYIPQNSDNTKSTVYPFSHPRSLLSDFYLAEKFLQKFINKVHSFKYIKPHPILIIHPMEKIEGGLLQIEERAFSELGLGAGASEVHIYEGNSIEIGGFEELLTKKQNYQTTPWGKLYKVLFTLIFGIAIVLYFNASN